MHFKLLGKEEQENKGGNKINLKNCDWTTPPHGFVRKIRSNTKIKLIQLHLAASTGILIFIRCLVFLLRCIPVCQWDVCKPVARIYSQEWTSARDVFINVHFHGQNSLSVVCIRSLGCGMFGKVPGKS